MMNNYTDDELKIIAAMKKEAGMTTVQIQDEIKNRDLRKEVINVNNFYTAMGSLLKKGMVKKEGSFPVKDPNKPEEEVTRGFYILT